MELSTCDQSTESVCSPCEDLSIIPVKQLKGTRLEWSTVCKEGYNCRGTKSCLFCGHLYAGGPDRTRYHLGLSRGSQKHMKLCNPSKVWQNRHLEVVAETVKGALTARTTAVTEQGEQGGCSKKCEQPGH